MNSTDNPRDNVIVRTWAHNNIIAQIFPISDLTGYQRWYSFIGSNSTKYWKNYEFRLFGTGTTNTAK
jgi:hypothetical protein